MEWEISSNGRFIWEEMEEEEKLRGSAAAVITDEQMEVLRVQISIYTTISEELLQMYSAITTTQQQDFIAEISHSPVVHERSDLLPGMKTKLHTRKRWTPTPEQKNFLEDTYKEQIGVLKRDLIKGLTSSLSVYGSVTEENVLYWFYNRRAKDKKKRSA